MQVSVIIPALNEAENIVAAIQSVKCQSGEMEDIDLMRRMPTYGRRVLVRNHPVTTSARRFFEHGVIRQEALNVMLVALWFSGVKPHTLAKWYTARRVNTLRN